MLCPLLSQPPSRALKNWGCEVVGFGIAALLNTVIQLYSFTILIYVLMSWFIRSANSPVVGQIYDFLGTVCEPYIGLFRRIIPATGGVDFSPMVAILVLHYLIRPGLLMLLGILGL